MNHFTALVPSLLFDPIKNSPSVDDYYTWSSLSIVSMRSCKTASQRDQMKAPSAVDDPEVVDEESECRGPLQNRRPPTRWGYSQLGEGEHRSTVAYLIN